MNCPLCGTSDVSVIDEIECDLITQSWLREFQIDVQAYLYADSIAHYVCSQCRLGFFSPPSPGGADMYAQLQQFDWYHEASKWEFGYAINEIPTGADVLEVGCGTGNFLELLESIGTHAVTGLESNAVAADMASTKGLSIMTHATDVPASAYDVVCAFQVLEHIVDPREFVEYMCSRLKTSGRLIVAVPNNDGFVGRDMRLPLNMPPHHVTRWGESTLRQLCSVLPLRVINIQREPLSKRHIDWYVSTRARSVSSSRIFRFLMWRVFGPILKAGLHMQKVRGRIRGHSIVGVFERV